MPNEFVQRRDLQQPYHLKAQTLQSLETAGAHDLVERLRNSVSEDALGLLRTGEKTEVVVEDVQLSAEIRLVVQKASSLLEQELDDEHFMASAIHESMAKQIAAERFEEMARWQKEMSSRYGTGVADAVMNRSGAKPLETCAKALLQELYFFTKADVRESYLYLPTKFAIELRDIEQELASLDTDLPEDPTPETVAMITKNQFRSVGLERRRKELTHLALEAEKWGGEFLHPSAEDVAAVQAAREADFAEMDATPLTEERSSFFPEEERVPLSRMLSGLFSMNGHDDHDPKLLPTGDLKSAWETRVSHMGDAAPAECVKRFCVEHTFSYPSLRAMHDYLCANPEAKEEVVFWTCHRGRLQCIREFLSMNNYINTPASLELSAEQEQRLLAAISDADIEHMLTQDDVVIRVILDTVKHAENQVFFLRRFIPGLATLDGNQFYKVGDSLESAIDRGLDGSVSELATEMYLSNAYLQTSTLVQFLYSRGKCLTVVYRKRVVERILSQVNLRHESEKLEELLRHPDNFHLDAEDIVRIQQKLEDNF